MRPSSYRHDKDAIPMQMQDKRETRGSYKCRSSTNNAFALPTKINSKNPNTEKDRSKNIASKTANTGPIVSLTVRRQLRALPFPILGIGKTTKPAFCYPFREDARDELNLLSQLIAFGKVFVSIFAVDRAVHELLKGPVQSLTAPNVVKRYLAGLFQYLGSLHGHAYKLSIPGV